MINNMTDAYKTDVNLLTNISQLKDSAILIKVYFGSPKVLCNFNYFKPLDKKKTDVVIC